MRIGCQCGDTTAGSLGLKGMGIYVRIRDVLVSKNLAGGSLGSE